MPLPSLTADAVELHAAAADWREAVAVAGRVLARNGITTERYGAEMVRMIEEHGPYVVIAPGLVLAHARPGPEVLGNGLAIVTLATPVDFGHPHNDPVSVVLGLAMTTADEHVAAVAHIANVFNDASAISELAAATAPDEAIAILARA
jgi:PTS system ascorbate-specific IIA component